MKYFDYNATTPLNASARQALIEAEDLFWYNPSSPYREGAQVHNLLEEARGFWASELKSDEKSIIFTSGATEATNALFSHFNHALRDDECIGISAIEHSAVYQSAKYYLGKRTHLLDINENGMLNLDSLYAFIEKSRPKLIALMAVNNETGIIQPWEEVLQICKDRGILFLCDAAQWLGKLPIGELGQCDFVIGCGHKFGGPKGVGFMKIPHYFPQFSISVGGGQEIGYRSGTENYPAIASMTAGYKASISFIEHNHRNYLAKRTAFEKSIRTHIPGTEIVGENSPRAWNTVGLIMPKHSNQRWIAHLNKKGFCVASGSACASKKEGSSHVLSAMRYSQEEAQRFLRVSSGWETTESDWGQLLEAFTMVWKILNADDSGSQSSVIDI